MDIKLTLIVVLFCLNNFSLERWGRCNILWTTDVLVYFGMSLFSVKLVGNLYFNYVAIGLIEIPAYAFGPVLLDK